MTTLREPIQPQADGRVRSVASPFFSQIGDQVGLTERRPADGATAAVRRSNLLLGLRLLAWSDAIEEGERRSFEDWLAA